ncbi:MAG: phage portal protein, partial [Candidatus Cloacimonetes bacterium]|nr:phage portal protein [Candidatus Cloacimonadota bacterium]
YSEFLYGDNTYMDLLGNSFWYIEKNQVGTPVGLYLLPAQDMKIKPSNKLFIEKYMMKNGDNLIEFAPDEIIHRKRFDPANQFFGMSPLAACESVYNMREYMDRYELHLYANDGRPSGIITTDEKVIGTSGWEDTRELLRREMAGLSNTGKIALLDRGFDYKRIRVSPKDLESLEGRKATASEIRNAFGQTDALYESSANRSTSESADYAFRKDAVAPRLKFLEDDINKQLLPLFDENLVLVFDNPVPVDIEKQAKQLKEFVTNTILTPNEARHAIGYGPHESILADELLIPVNLASVSQAYMQNQANGEEGKKEDD